MAASWVSDVQRSTRTSVRSSAERAVSVPAMTRCAISGAPLRRAVVGVLVVNDAALELPVPEVAGVPDDPADASDPDVVLRGDGAAGREPPLLTAADATIELRAAEGEVIDSLVLPVEGGSSVLSLAVRPGSTPDELAAAVLTEAEGMVDLRVVRRDADGLGIELVAPGIPADHRRRPARREWSGVQPGRHGPRLAGGRSGDDPPYDRLGRRGTRDR